MRNLLASMLSGVALSGFLLCGVAHADDNIGIVTPKCFIHAANVNHISVSILAALMKTEGGRSGMTRLNKNGSHDLGVMQVNDRTWVPKIARQYFGGDTSAAYATIRDNGCYNVMVGASIFSTYLDESGGDYMKAIGYYNSHTPYYMQKYQNTVMSKYMYVYNVFRSHHVVN